MSKEGMKMSRNKQWTTRRTLTLGLTLLLGAGCVTSAWAGKKDKAPAKPVQLVWPLPPEKPRIKFVTEIRGASDVEAVKKQNFLDRMAGIQKQDFKPSFIKPHGIATDSKNRIYVSDSGQGVIFVFDREKKKVSYIGKGIQVRLRVPLGLTVDKKDRLWVADGVGQHVYGFDPDGNVIMALGATDQMQNPTSVAVDDSRNRIYVVDSKQHCVLVYDSESGTFIKKLGERGGGKLEFNFPTNIALDSKGNLYVTDTLNFRVQVIDPDGNFVSGFGGMGNKLGQFLKPKGIAIDQWQNVYVVDADFDNFQVFDPDLRLLLFLGGAGVFPGRFWLPADIHVDGQGFVYVSDQNNKRIQIFQVMDGSVNDQDRAAPKLAAGPKPKTGESKDEIPDPTKSH
jgi:DNA-binding beta-propeller fold protein YncE